MVGRGMTRTALICAIAAAGWLIWPLTHAQAGTYRAAQCHAKFGVGPADIDFRRTSTHYQSDAACGTGGVGLAVTHKASHTNTGRWGAWTAMAPAGTRFVRASAMVSGRRRAGHVPQFLVGPMEALVPFGTATGGFHRITWRGAGVRGVRAALRCGARGKCGPGSEARVRVRRLMLTIVDSSPPRVTAGGSLFAGGARRASEQICVSAHDAGSGVHRVFVQVNGEPVVANTLGCALKGHVALRLSPCPAHATPQFSASTAPAAVPAGPEPRSRLRDGLRARHRKQPRLRGASCAGRQRLSTVWCRCRYPHPSPPPQGGPPAAFPRPGEARRAPSRLRR